MMILEAFAMKTLALFLLTASTSVALPVLDDRQYSSTKFLLGAPVVHNGPYQFLGCSSAEAQALITVFQKTGTVLSNTIIPAVTRPSPDPNQDPFITFFSTNDRGLVQKVFNDMNNGATQTQGGAPIERPNIICINPTSSPYIGRALELCGEKKDGIGITYSGQILLCPKFFTDPPFPDPAVNCPAVNYTGKLNQVQYASHKFAFRNQFFGLIHELSHIYSPHTVPGNREIYDLNRLIYQSADFQLNNANNYGYYAVSVYMRCRYYPMRLAVDPFGKSRRELAMPEEQMDDYRKRQVDSIEFPAGNNNVSFFWDDADASYFAGVDFDALLADLTDLGD